MTTVCTAWPKAFASDTLPLLLVQLAGESPADHRDDAEYLTEREWYVRVFAAKESVLLPLCERVQGALETLGYARSFRWDEGEADVRQVAFRFTKTTY